MLIVLDLCAGTGAWSRPYKEAGYTVERIDVHDGRDVRLLESGTLTGVRGILAAPPCTVFARSGARWPRTENDMREALSVVDACVRIAWATNPVWWALENPIGTLRRYLGEPRLYFQPADYGDPYTKRTCVWGKFAWPYKRPVEASDGSRLWRDLGGKTERTKRLRSVTPDGFARAFFGANP